MAKRVQMYNWWTCRWWLRRCTPLGSTGWSSSSCSCPHTPPPKLNRSFCIFLGGIKPWNLGSFYAACFTFPSASSVYMYNAQLWIMKCALFDVNLCQLSFLITLCSSYSSSSSYFLFGAQIFRWFCVQSTYLLGSVGGWVGRVASATTCPIITLSCIE